jgi:hypothetical protein
VVEILGLPTGLPYNTVKMLSQSLEQDHLAYAHVSHWELSSLVRPLKSRAYNTDVGQGTDERAEWDGWPTTVVVFGTTSRRWMANVGSPRSYHGCTNKYSVILHSI